MSICNIIAHEASYRFKDLVKMVIVAMIISRNDHQFSIAVLTCSIYRIADRDRLVFISVYDEHRPFVFSDSFKAILPLSPAVMITEGARTGNALRFRFDPDHIPDYLPVADGMRVNGNYIRAAQMLDVDEAIRKYKGPVLIVMHTIRNEYIFLYLL